jgi:hypothetical protein
MRPEDKRNRRAGLLIRRAVGQLVVGGESLVLRLVANPARDVGASLRCVVPHAQQHLQQLLAQGGVVGLGGEVSRARKQVRRAHRVPHNLPMFQQRQVVLPNRAVVLLQRGVMLLREELFATIQQEKLGKPLVARFARRTVQPKQREFDFGMPAVAQSLTRRVAEDRVDVVGEASGNG